MENIKETNLIDFIESTVKDETNDEMNFNEPDIKSHEVRDEINVIDFNESDINNQQNKNSNENNKEDTNSLETVTFYGDLKVIFDITSALAESFESEYVQIETKFQ